jgi:hypothetical protein
MNVMEDIPKLLEEGYSHDDILETLQEISPDLEGQFKDLQKEGFSSQDILSTFLELSPDQQQQFISPEIVQQDVAQPPQREDISLKSAPKGLAQGFTDLLDLGMLPTSLLLDEEGRKQVQTPGQEALARASFDNPFIDVDDDIAAPVMTPGGLSQLKELLGFGVERPYTENIVQEIPRRLVRGAPFGATGIFSELFGLGGAKGAEAIGFGETGQMISDIVAGFLSPAGKAKKAVESLPKIAQTPSKIAQAEMKVRPQQVQKVIEGISAQQIEKLGQTLGETGEKLYERLPTINARKIEQDIIQGAKLDELKKIASEVPTNEVAWNKISDSVEGFVKEEKKRFNTLYEGIAKRASEIEAVPSQSLQKAKDLEKKLSSPRTKAFGQKQVESALETARFDLGERTTNNIKKLLSNLTEGEKSKKFAQILGENDLNTTTGLLKKAATYQEKVNVNDMMRLKRNLTSLVNYEATDPNIRNLLKSVSREIQKDILTSLDKAPTLKNAYIQTDKAYGKFSRTIGQEAVDFLRKKDAPEAALTRFLQGSNAKTMKNLLRKDPEAFARFEQQIVKKLGEMSNIEAEKAFRELSPHLSENANRSAKNILEMGDTLSNKGSRNVLQQKILSDIQQASTSGTRPSLTLDLMKNPKGYNITKQMLEKSPKGRKILKNLQKQAVQDVFSSLTTDAGIIKWDKAKDILRDPHVRTIIRDAAGKEGLAFADNLERLSKNISTNIEKANIKAPKSLRESMFSAAGLTAKSMLASLLGGKAGVLAYLGFAVMPKISKEIYYRMLISPTVRNGMKKLANPASWAPAKIGKIIQEIDSGLESNQE